MGNPRVCLAMIFLLCALVPLGASYLVHHPDERHYTDAGLEMVKTGDYVVPRNSDGTARLRKPALCYWMVSASFSAFGPSPLSARLPFILCGVAIVWLTHRLATAVTASNEAAWISTLLVLSNGLFLTSAARSIPDVVVCLFLLLSALGFVQVLVLGARKPSAYYCAYVGAGLAFASKGLLAAAFVGYVFAFQVCRRRSLKALLDLIHLKAIVCGVLIAGSWFLLAYWRLGGEVASVFWSDQVRQKMSVDLVTPLYQVPLYGVITVVSFLPWMAAGAHQLVRERRMFAFRSDREREYWLFVAPWAVVTAVIFGCSSSLYSRYCLPIIPLLAVSLGPALLRIKREIL